MRPQTWIIPQIVMNVLLVLMLVEFGFADTPTATRSDNSLEKLTEFNYKPYKPEPYGAPGNRGDAGSRSPFDFMVLVPVGNLGLTSLEYPTFWLSVKTVVSEPVSVDFELRDETENVIYKTTFEIDQGQGMISFQLPEGSPPLAINQKYHWYFFSAEMRRHGWVERVKLEPELEHQLKTASSPERLVLLAQNSLWYEMFSELAQLRRLHPDNSELATVWTALLTDPNIRLEKIATQPFLSCCSNEQ